LLYAIGYTIFYLFASKVLYSEGQNEKYYSMADFFEHRYGEKVGGFIGFLCALSLFGWILTNLIAGGQLLSSISGWSSLFTTTTISVVIAIYLVVGGFSAVVRTDVIQYIALIIITVVIAFALYKIPETGFSSSVNNNAFPSQMPLKQSLFFVFIGAMFPMGSAELWQRVYATKDKTDFRNAIILASSSFFIIGGLLSYVCYRLLSLESSSGNTAAELGLALGVSNLVGPTLSSLWFIAFASAIISSADTFMYTTASSIVQDMMLRLKWIEQKQVLSYIRGTIISLALFGILGAVLFEDVVTVTFYFVGITLILGITSIMVWKVKDNISGRGIIISGVIGLVLSSAHGIIEGISLVTAIVALVASFVILVVSALIHKYF
jgi:SSS family solute:Na+ symporter